MYDLDSFNEACRRADEAASTKRQPRTNGAPAQGATAREWLCQCAKDGRGEPISNLANTMIALRNDPALKDAFAFDEMQRAPLLMRPIATDGLAFEQRLVTDVDLSALQEWLQLAGLRNLAKRRRITRSICGRKNAPSIPSAFILRDPLGWNAAFGCVFRQIFRREGHPRCRSSRVYVFGQHGRPYLRAWM